MDQHLYVTFCLALINSLHFYAWLHFIRVSRVLAFCLDLIVPRESIIWIKLLGQERSEDAGICVLYATVWLYQQITNELVSEDFADPINIWKKYVMKIWFHQATSHYPNECWPRAPTSLGRNKLISIGNTIVITMKTQSFFEFCK